MAKVQKIEQTPQMAARAAGPRSGEGMKKATAELGR
jgi:hypothetical protein